MAHNSVNSHPTTIHYELWEPVQEQEPVLALTTDNAGLTFTIGMPSLGLSSPENPSGFSAEQNGFNRRDKNCSKCGLVVRGPSGLFGHMGLKSSKESREWPVHILGL